MIAPGRRSKCCVDQIGDLLFFDPARAEALDEDGDRLGDADRIGDLDLAAVGQTCGDDVLGHVARRVRRRPVDLGGIFAGERSAAVTGHAAVGVDDDLAAGEAGIAHRPADDEAPGRVDEDARVVVAQLPGDGRLDDMLDDVSTDDVQGTSSACWAETTTASTRTGLWPSYSTVTCALAVRPQIRDGAVLARGGELRVSS